MKVKAKWNVKGSDGWHMAGEVFETNEDFGDAVEALDAPQKAEPKAQEPVKEPEKAEETEQETQKAKNSRRRNAK